MGSFAYISNERLHDQAPDAPVTSSLLRLNPVVDRDTVARIITGENLLLTLLGVIPGLILGVLAGRAFLATYANDQFRLELAVRPLTLAVSAAAILLVALASQRPGLRAIARLDLAATVRERAG